MTNDELLSKLLLSDKTDVYKTLRLWQAALSAVVELHKPRLKALPVETCFACQDIYPCFTIQVIEKELN